MNNKAFSLLEVLLVLALGAVVSIIAVRYYSEVRQTQKITTFTSQLTGITNAVEKCYAGSQNGDTSDCTSMTNLKSAGYLSDYYTNSPWNTTINLTIMNGNQVKITSSIDTNACSKVASRLKTVESQTGNNSFTCSGSSATYTYTIN